MPRRKKRSFTPEQKANAVRLARELGSVAQATRDLDLTKSSLSRWVKQAEVDEGKDPEGAPPPRRSRRASTRRPPGLGPCAGD